MKRNRPMRRKQSKEKVEWKNTMLQAGKAISSNRLKDAYAHLQRALSLAENAREPGMRAETHTLLGWLLEGLNDMDQAVEHFHRAAAIASVVWGPESQAHAQAMHHLAEALMLQGDFEQAESLAIAAYEIQCAEAKKNCRMANYFLPTSLTLLSRISFRKGNVEQARKWLEVYAENRGMGAELAEIGTDDFELLFYNIDAPKETIKHIPARIATFAPQF